MCSGAREGGHCTCPAPQKTNALLCMDACAGGEGSGASSAERMPKNWAEVAAALLGPVEHRTQQLTSAFSDALRGGACPHSCNWVALHAVLVMQTVIVCSGKLEHAAAIIHQRTSRITSAVAAQQCYLEYWPSDTWLDAKAKSQYFASQRSTRWLQGCSSAAVCGTGQLSTLVNPSGHQAPMQPPRPGQAEHWATARLQSASSDPSIALPVSAWRLEGAHDNADRTHQSPLHGKPAWLQLAACGEVKVVSCEVLKQQVWHAKSCSAVGVPAGQRQVSGSAPAKLGSERVQQPEQQGAQHSQHASPPTPSPGNRAAHAPGGYFKVQLQCCANIPHRTYLRSDLLKLDTGK